MSEALSLAESLMENLSVSVSLVHSRSHFGGWNRTDEIPSFSRLYYIADGEGSVLLNGELHYPKPGQLMIMPAGSVQTTTTSRDNPYTRHFCHFDAKIGEWPLFAPEGKLILVDAEEPEATRRLFLNMEEQFSQGGYLAPLRLKSALLHLLAYCMEHSGYTAELDRFLFHEERVKLGSVLQYIEEHLDQTIEIDTLADIIHLHPNYFIPYFKKLMGVTPIHYVQQKRMDKAKRLLSFSNLSISDTAEQLGMDLPHFSRTFKKATGVSPSSYRRGTT
ncbi:AraC family transcriptional regulator [Paenibacillus yonginensis]|uniref:AraC family transcriptional regulator n=1 Tax=Paenibacillus yonginensis TaxID=1462996 RepID=A0A1B1MZ49_9BACL|nr:AraC family transcriptional regulator [Paenibacillus yonginensis]ANS74438.1 AraC family transcriptional regulator [Paenibacillus yonginensis]